MAIDFTVKDVRHRVVTQSSTKHGAVVLKNLREVRSDFKLTVQA
jgi:hypothetical protein